MAEKYYERLCCVCKKPVPNGSANTYCGEHKQYTITRKATVQKARGGKKKKSSKPVQNPFLNRSRRFNLGARKKHELKLRHMKSDKDKANNT